MNEALLDAQNIRKSYHREQVLDIGRITLDSGELVTLCGPNGAGKTTCLRILAGLLKPARGAKFRVRGKAARRPVPGRDCGFLQQHPYMLNTTVRGNIEYALKSSGSACSDRAHDALAWAGLAQLADRCALELSAGQRQLLAIARLHAAGAPVLLLDEPSASLDGAGCAVLARMLAMLCAARRAALVSTHDERMEKLLPDARRLRLVRGRLEQSSKGAKA